MKAYVTPERDVVLQLSPAEARALRKNKIQE